MTAKPVVPRALANRDIDNAISYYLGEDAGQAALGFIDALEQVYAHISHHPATGSSRYAHELNLPGLRLWPLLDGYRGRPKADMAAVADIALRLGARMLDDDSLEEIEINPILARQQGAVAVDALIRKV